MIRTRRLASAALVFTVTSIMGVALIAVDPGPRAGATTPKTAASAAPRPVLPQPVAARSAAQWLVGQFKPQAFIPTAPGSTEPDLSATAQSVLALSAADTDLPLARSALSYLSGHVDQYVTQEGADGPAQLALLILDTEAMGEDPQSFGGTDLVARLLATEQTSGPDAGLFGTETQLNNYDTGTYEQGLALAALAAAGVHNPSQTGTAVSWLLAQQCPDGGWPLPDVALNACNGLPVDFAGPDTNSTALAAEGLVAQGALDPAARSGALAFQTAAQDPDGGWSQYPNTAADPQSTDPDSTALVIQSLIALGVSPASSAFVHGQANPVSVLLSFQLTSGPGSGGFFFPPTPAPADLLATYQAVPALAGLSFPFGPSGRSYWEVAADGGIFTFGDARYYGSMGGTVLNRPVVGMATTPDGGGYWEVASDGGIFSFGDAVFHGSTGGTVLNKPVVGMAATPDGLGYWLVAADGGVFAFGDARYYGSTGGTVLNKPVVGMAATPDGRGYWLVAADGGIFSFGDARYYGSTGGTVLNKPVVGMAATPDGLGYWLVAADGGVFSFGDARYYGSTGGTVLNKPVVGMAATPDGLGYWLVAADGGVFSFGDAGFQGSTGGTSLNQPVVGMVAGLARPA